MRKILLSIVALILAGLMLVGCGNTETGGEAASVQEKVEKTPAKGTTTIYVATLKETEYSTGGTRIEYQLNKDGVVITENSINTYAEEDIKEIKSSVAYVLDYENIMQNMDTGAENDDELAGKYRKLIDGKKNIIKDDSAIKILSIDSQKKICRSVRTTLDENWQKICEDGTHFDYRYNGAGKRVENISFINGNIRMITTMEYNSENKLISQKSSDLAINREINLEYTYDSENRVASYYFSTVALDSGAIAANHVQCSYNENGKLEKEITLETNDISLCKYDENGKLIKTSSYLSDGTLSSVTTYTYEEIKVPSESVDFLCHLYGHIGIRYEIIE